MLYDFYWLLYVIFFCKQKTAYEMRISDWSSDVCSSDLIPWPPTRLFVSLPHHERLVAAMLHYDVIGFQSLEWLESFLHYCRKEPGAEVDEDSGTVRIAARSTIPRAFPIGIDHAEFMPLGAPEIARSPPPPHNATTPRRARGDKDGET